MNVASVVIPAHNEASVLSSTLQRIADDPLAPALEVAVVANACTDDTADIARAFLPSVPGLVVVETEVPGKANALNLGDEAVSAFPRIYLDADIVLGPDALGGMVDALAVDAPVAGSPDIEFDLDGADRWVREYYRMFERLPYVTDDLVGLGVYGLSEAGRGRFDEFPDVLADDLYIQRLFTPQERVRTPGRFAVRTPRRWRELVKVRTRVDRGNAQLATTTEPGAGFERTSGASVKALARALAVQPGLLPAATVYVGTTIAARVRSRLSDDYSWGRDESTRQPADGAAPAGAGAQAVPDAAAPVPIEGVPFTRQTEAEVVDTVFDALAGQRGGRIVTPNVDILQAVRRKPELRRLVRTADLVVADGMPIVWASRLRGTPLPERVSGADLVWSLAERAAEEGRSVYLLGGRPGVAQRAGRTFTERFPGLRIVGHDSPEWGFEHSPDAMRALIARLTDAGPDLVYLALGFPKQDLVAATLAQHLPQTWFLGCGGALDMVAGEVERASGAAQKLGAEWIVRLLQEPRRLARRYLLDDAPYAASLLTRSTLDGVTGVSKG
ncbi:N-acetylglucosaminyldiphosphoundecaprenol N-acetyl-beta-D-mannosaminyltransferase [Propionicimonas sp. T2.31MG-18]|uniref:WecB/TagA/CpsF family glycosyltransferase n=1 Tax=Propionicimonas sp. T2.31MG-18 TaxID=3157620 RepID=UPI0035E5EB64